MPIMKSLIILFIFATYVAGHTSITGVKINGGPPQNCFRDVKSQSPISTLYEPYDYTATNQYTCGLLPLAANAAPSKCSVNAGGSVGVQYWWGPSPDAPSEQYIASSHKGPIMGYMARWEQSGGLPTGPVWFKVYHADIIEYGPVSEASSPDAWYLNKWASNSLLNRQGGVITFNVPSDIQAGNYLLRMELIAYHDNRPRGAQPYVFCMELTVTGGGSATPSGAAFPGSYDWSDPGMSYNLYTAPPQGKYPPPGGFQVYVPGGNPTPTPTPTPTPGPNPTPSPTPTPGTNDPYPADWPNVKQSYAQLPAGTTWCAEVAPVKYCARLQNDGNFVVIDKSNTVIWSSKTAGVVGDYVLSLQGDGNLVTSLGTQIIWSSDSYGKSTKEPFSLMIQADGNLVYYDASRTAVWSSGTVVLAVADPPYGNSTYPIPIPSPSTNTSTTQSSNAGGDGSSLFAVSSSTRIASAVLLIVMLTFLLLCC